MSATRAEFVAAARGYIGTPWAHGGRRPGVELDCVGVIVCAARQVGLIAPDWDTAPYSQVPDGALMLRSCDAYMDRIARTAMQPGDVVCLVTDTDPQHLGVLGDYRHGGLSLIHSANNARPARVLETRLMLARNLRLVAAFAVRGIV